jgi:hypothetical protein
MIFHFVTEWKRFTAKETFADKCKFHFSKLKIPIIFRYQQQVRNKNKVTDLMIKEQAKYYARLLHYNEFVPSNIWLHNFKTCYKVTSVRTIGI